MMFRRILCTVFTSLYNFRAIPRAFSLYQNLSFKFLNDFLQIHGSHQINFFSYPAVSRTFAELLVHNHFSCEKALQAESGISLNQLWRNSQTRNEKKTCTKRFATTAMNRVHDRYFHLHILTLILLFIVKIWNYFFFSYIMDFPPSSIIFCSNLTSF